MSVHPKLHENVQLQYKVAKLLYYIILLIYIDLSITVCWNPKLYSEGCICVSELTKNKCDKAENEGNSLQVKESSDWRR